MEVLDGVGGLVGTGVFEVAGAGLVLDTVLEALVA